jgi:ElaB/YqjD/DUF883 family membrane-anchored ribosome-binding protein
MEESMEAITKEKLVEDLKTVGHDVEDLVKATANRTDERITAARSRAQATLRNTHARLTDGTNAVTARARAAARATDQYVHDNPWQVLGVVAGFGFLSGYLLSRR